MTTLYIGNKAYSSWSLRAWLLLTQAGVAFDEVVLPLAGPGQRTTAIAAHSPSGKVPVLADGDVVVWDSLAIAEYIAEQHPELWPVDRAARAYARSMAAEMHSGFLALRTHLPMNVRRAPAPLAYGVTVADDIGRIAAMWRQCRARFAAHGEGPFLFGRFGVVDAMFAPVCTRFHSYGVELDADTAAYVDAILQLPALRAWIAAAHQEAWRIPEYESVGANAEAKAEN